MRNIKILIFTFLLFAFNSILAQAIKFGGNAYSHIATHNGNLLANWTQPTTFKINPIFKRSDIEPWVSLPIKGEFLLDYYDQDANENKVLFTSTFTEADWQTGGFISNVLTRDVTIPAGFASPSISKSINLRYRYYRNGYPYPENTNGWTEWYYLESKTIVVNPNTIPVTSFDGPAQICNEGIYTITNPYNISLENASGIATLIDMGLNQWKVTRIGNASGSVNLVSTTNGKIYKNNIHIGPLFQGQIDGYGALKRGWANRVYSLYEGGGPYTNHKWTISDNRITMVPNGTTVKLSVPSSYQVSDPMEGDWITLKCTMDSECGPVSTSMQINIMPL